MTLQTLHESYEFLVMFFGLCNMPTTFKSIINLVFHDKMDKFVVKYINETSIYSKSEEDHLQELKKILDRLK